MTEERKWFVKLAAARDHFDDCTVPVDQWVKDDPLERWEEFASAIVAITQTHGWKGELRQEPRVAYDALEDCHCFLFKFEKNGDTLIVSREPISEDIPAAFANEESLLTT